MCLLKTGLSSGHIHSAGLTLGQSNTEETHDFFGDYQSAAGGPRGCR